ncbi:hypothetical protein ACF5W4_13425 [Bacillota bacterium Lsc_1132]
MIGLTLMGLTANSLKFVSANKASVEDKASAEMAVEEAMAQIDNMVATINTEISSNRLLIDSVKMRVQSALDQIKSRGTHPFTITHTTKNNMENGAYVENVMIKAPIGKSGKYIIKTLNLSTISKIFNYTVVSPGNLSLFGAPYIEGDVLVGGNINTLNLFGSPSIKGNLMVKGKYYTGFIGLTEYLPTENNLKKYFSVPPIIKQWQETEIVPINVINSIEAKSSPLKTTMSITKLKDALQSPNQIGYSAASNITIKRNESFTINGNLVVPGNFIMEQGSTLNINGSIMVYGAAELSGTLKFTENNYLYVKKKAILANLILEGPVYADDVVELEQKIDSNGTIYVRNGATLIDFFSNTQHQTLIIASNGPINLFFNNIFREDPEVMNAFFYTNSSLNMLGITSNIRINGGIYGNPINLAALNTKNLQLSILYNHDMLKNMPIGIPTASKITIKELNTVYDNK